MAEARASPALRTPGSSASGSPGSSAKKGPGRKGLSLQSIARSLDRTNTRESTDRTAPARHRQLDFDADSVVGGGDEGSNGGDQDADNAEGETQDLTEEPEEEAAPEGSNTNSEPQEHLLDPEETESSSSSEDDPADETFVPESEENSEETETDESAVDEVPAKTRGRPRSATRRPSVRRMGTERSSARSPPRTGRRRTVRWTQEEVDFLRSGVRERGPGAWKKILLNGRGIFLPHRTNVDLKDKWMNLIKRYGEGVLLSEDEIEGSVRARPNLSGPIDGSGSSTTSSKRKRDDSIGSDDGEAASFAPSADEADNQSSQWVDLKISADSFFPMSQSTRVNLAKCADVQTLKKRIRTKLLPKISPDAAVPARIQLVSIGSRRLLGNDEQLSRCIREDGNELYVIPGSP